MPSLSMLNASRVSEAIKQFVEAVLQAYGSNVVSIVLFGSRARGDWTHYSDADILVILSQHPKRLIDRLSEFATYSPSGLVEPFVYTKEEIETMFQSRNAFLLDILMYGIPLFDQGFWKDLRNRFEALLEKGVIQRFKSGWRIGG